MTSFLGLSARKPPSTTLPPTAAVQYFTDADLPGSSVSQNNRASSAATIPPTLNSLLPHDGGSYGITTTSNIPVSEIEQSKSLLAEIGGTEKGDNDDSIVTINPANEDAGNVGFYGASGMKHDNSGGGGNYKRTTQYWIKANVIALYFTVSDFIKNIVNPKVDPRIISSGDAMSDDPLDTISERRIWMNLIIALVVLLCGIVIISMTWQDYNHSTFVKEITEETIINNAEPQEGHDYDNILPPQYLMPSKSPPTTKGNNDSDDNEGNISPDYFVGKFKYPLIILMTKSRQLTYVLQVILSLLAALSDRRGKLPGFPGITKYFRGFLISNRILLFISFINTTNVLFNKYPDLINKCIIVLCVGLLFKFISFFQRCTGYYYVATVSIWNILYTVFTCMAYSGKYIWL